MLNAGILEEGMGMGTGFRGYSFPKEPRFP